MQIENPEIPDDLVREIKEGRAVLFLGAGASFGAANGASRIPLSAELGAEIAREFRLSAEAAQEVFPVIYDYACSAADVRRVQKFIKKTLEPFEPAPYHLKIVEFPWHGIVTTNYDLVVERAYSDDTRSINLKPIRDDQDSIEDAIANGELPYIKLHGCVTRANSLTPPMVASTEQLIKFRDGRRQQLSTFMEWAESKTLVFCGYRLLDQNIRTIFQEIISLGDGRPTHYIILPDPPPEARRYWSNRRVELIPTSFENFINALGLRIPRSTAKLGHLLSEMTRTSFSKYIDNPDRRESVALTEYLTKRIQHLASGMVHSPADAKRFYSGFNQGWAPIADSLDIARPVGTDLIRDQIIPSRSRSKPRFIIVKGHAGSGKTIVLRRTAWDAALKYDRLTFFIARENVLSVPSFLEIAQLTSFEPYVFIDNVEEHRSEIEHIVEEFGRLNRVITIVGSADTNHWNVACQNLHPLVSDEYEMRYLSMPEIDALLDKLSEHGSLGALARKPRAEQRTELKEIYGRQLIVALLEATNGIPLYEILSDEYKRIVPIEARQLYLNICSLHRFGPPVRAGVIKRLTGVDFEDFRIKLLPPLENIVRLRDDARTGDIVYEARHSHIASVVYEQAFPDEDARFDNVINILRNLNMAFSYDQEVFGQIIKADNVRRTFAGKERGRQIYDVAEEYMGPNVGLLHQRAIYEMSVAITGRDLDTASEILSRAVMIDGHSRALKHTAAEVELRRSRLAEDLVQREAYRRYAIELASDLTTGGQSSSYPWHTIVKAKIDRVKDVIDSASGGDQVAFAELDAATSDAEATLRKALQRFPNESVLVAEEGNLQHILANALRAEESFRRAFELNQRSSLMAKKLALVRRARGDFQGAVDVLQKALEFNPGDGSLHYELARSQMALSPVADTSEAETILYHLKRAFHQGSKDQQVKFWYARQLALTGKWEDAREMFVELSSLNMSFDDKKRIRGFIRAEDGENARLDGVVTVVRATYAIVEDERFRLTAIIAGREMPENPLKEGQSVTYELGFTLKGPSAVRVA